MLDTLPSDLHPLEILGLTTDRAVSYTASNLPTALAEVLQRTRVAQLSSGRAVPTAWSPSRRLLVLDLTGTQPIQAGAA